jgi:uncharacterized membrane protein YphA (DoxX/SURF4 family)
MQRSKAGNVALWALQALLAALFLFAGIMKLGMSTSQLAQIGLPVAFMRFIAIAELAGGLGLLLPGLVRIRRELTPLAASGLSVIMIGAVLFSALRISIGAAVPPLVTGLLLAVVLRGRRGWAVSIS